MDKAIVYIRTASDDPMPLEQQQAVCQHYAEQYGLEIATVVQDTASGYTLDRPGLNEVRQRIQAHEVTMVLVETMDRLTQDPQDLADLIEEFHTYGSVVVAAEPQS